MTRMFKWIFLTCVIAGIVVGVSFVRDVFLISPNTHSKPIEITIQPGASVKSIANQLHTSNLVAHPLFFQWFTAWSHTANKLQAGTFSFLQNSSIASIVLTLSNPSISEIQLTIPEGFTNDQIKQKLVEAFSTFDQAAWKAQTKNLEGYLFPDTYRFSKEASVKDIVDKLRSTFDRRLRENNIDQSSLYTTIIMASIIEKEVKSPEDMKRVAGVLFNRLNIGMALQVDSTLTYVTQKTSAQLTTADLKSVSLYNTYTHKGLPPTPICNPGMQAILAVMHPTESNDLYFLTKPDGTAVFARTHEEHVRNKEKYLR